jgi:hypothetical protein
MALITQPATVAPSPVAGPVPNLPDTPAANGGVLLASLVLLPIGLLLVVARGLAQRLIGAARDP